MIPSSTQTNSATPIAEPTKAQPAAVGPQPQTEAEKKALAEKNGASNSGVKA